MGGRLGSLTTLPTPPNTDPQTLNLFCHLRSIFPKACSHENVKPYQVAYSFLSWLLADIMRFWINEIERKRAFIAYSSYSSYFHMYIMIHHLWSAASILDVFYSANQFQNLKIYNYTMIYYNLSRIIYVVVTYILVLQVEVRNGNIKLVLYRGMYRVFESTRVKKVKLDLSFRALLYFTYSK